jgi:hypothetical protein
MLVKQIWKLKYWDQQEGSKYKGSKKWSTPFLRHENYSTKRMSMTLILVLPKESRKSDDKDGPARNISMRNRSSRGSILEFPKPNISHGNEATNPPEVNSRERLSPRQGNYTQENMQCICHEFRWSKSANIELHKPVHHVQEIKR